MIIQHSNSSAQFSSPRFFRRKLQDVRIWKQITVAGLEWAAQRICRGYSYIVQGGNVRVSSWTERVSTSYNHHGGGAEVSDWEYLQRCKQDYLRWVDACRQRGVCSPAAMDILFFGSQAREIEQRYRRRHGWAISNLLQALELYRK